MELNEPWYRSNSIVVMLMPFPALAIGFANTVLSGTALHAARLVFVAAIMGLVMWMGINARSTRT